MASTHNHGKQWTAIPSAEPLMGMGATRVRIELLEGASVQATPPRCVEGGSCIRGLRESISLSDSQLSRGVLFIGAPGQGKTNAMMHLMANRRAGTGLADVVIIFDTKGDYLREFYQPGDVVISNARDLPRGGARWNLFRDLLAQTDELRADEILEIAGTIFEEQQQSAGENVFFSIGARDVFAAVVEALSRDGVAHSNDDLRRILEGSPAELWSLIEPHSDLRGVLHYLAGSAEDSAGARAVQAFMTQVVKSTFSGAFRLPGDFSVREFVRARGGHALFIEYDIAAGTLLLPIYRLLIDLALKEALSRQRPQGNVYFIMDEFSLLPKLRHVADGINFGRGLGLKFVVGAQNVGQVYHAYGEDVGKGILGAFGTVFAFRVLDERSRAFIRERYGANRKLVTTESTDLAVGVERNVVTGNVIEDWDLSALTTGQAIAGLPDADPFYFEFAQYRGRTEPAS